MAAACLSIDERAEIVRLLASGRPPSRVAAIMEISESLARYYHSRFCRHFVLLRKNPRMVFEVLNDAVDLRDAAGFPKPEELAYRRRKLARMLDEYIDPRIHDAAESVWKAFVEDNGHTLVFEAA